jgi:heme exporter protein A
VTLRAEALSCVRGERLIFAGLEFALGPGEALALRGPNGAGKSSLLRLLATLLKPAAGRLAWEGADVWEDVETYRRRLAYVGHLDALKANLTVAENLRFWARLASGRSVVTPALDVLGIAPLADVPARLLSAGQRRRAALARLEVSAAELWLLDEPDASLDDDGLERLSGMIDRQLTRGGRVVVATHHDLGESAAKIVRLGTGTGA